jgi:signal transduction histidine kinase
VQEALTNVVRHADASRVSVLIAEDGGALVIEVADDGPGRPGDVGNGIRGMKERATALGGELTAGRQAGGGWRVRASLPLRTP